MNTEAAAIHDPDSRPWSVHLDSRGVPSVVSHGNWCVVEMASDDPLDHSNAALIVKAVNSWDNVDALQTRITELGRRP